MTYLCSKCGTDQDKNQFYFYPSGKRESYCYICKRIIDNARTKTPRRKLSRKLTRKKTTENNRNRIRGFKNKPCLDCREEHFYFAMDMDHIEAKLYNMSDMSYRSVTKITAESKKCEPICANCHRIRSHDRKTDGIRSRIKNNVRPRKSKYDENWKPASPLSGRNKICFECKKELPIEWFGRRSDHPEKPASRCHLCESIYQAKWFQNHFLEQKEKIFANKAVYKEKSRNYIISYKEERGCYDCRKKWPAHVLDFDHIKGDKKATIGSMPGRYSLELIIAEIAKCEVICARCHRYRTHARLTGEPNLNPNLVKSI
jgi:hypothetical protein